METYYLEFQGYAMRNFLRQAVDYARIPLVSMTQSLYFDKAESISYKS